MFNIKSRNIINYKRGKNLNYENTRQKLIT